VSDEIIIRSSASTEDQNSTNAGHFESVQHVDPKDRNFVIDGIDVVIRSYENDGLPDSELIFVQKQLTNVFVAGVAFSFVPNNQKPYFLVNYDDNGSTDSVTSGKCKKYMYIARDFVGSDCWESKLCCALLEVEQHCKEINLDIEFAITTDGIIYIFQVRRLLAILAVENKTESLRQKNLLALDFSTKNELLSDMAFWNPSEIIGDAPHPLDYSLYNYLVTDNAWNKGIADIGYYSTSDNLMVKIGNKPYIKLKTTFRSLLPASINHQLREELTNIYIQILQDDKNLHDKVEFEIVHNCYDFSTDNKLAELRKFGLSHEKISILSEMLFQTTKSIIEQYDVILSNDLKKLTFLEQALENCKANYSLENHDGIIQAIAYLMPIIRDFGVIPFSCQARCAFIARSLCISMVDMGFIEPEIMDAFMRSIKSVTSELQADAILYNSDESKRDSIENKYGHLRSHSYDITSKTYSEMGFAEIFSGADNGQSMENTVKDHSITAIDVCFPRTDINLTDFIRKSLAQREYFKFIFTKGLSFVLDLVTRLANQMNISRHDISYSTIEYIMQLRSDHDMQNSLINDINKNKEEYDLNSLIILPPIIANLQDFNVIRVDESDPNFITNHSIEGDTLLINGLSQGTLDVSGKIVVIQYADPGYDWIFASGTLAGLITQYGGMASHMAIRCMEFDVPAAIGCGELIYNQIAQSERISIDCVAKEVMIIK